MEATVEEEGEEEETGAEGAAVEGPAGGSSRVRSASLCVEGCVCALDYVLKSINDPHVSVHTYTHSHQESAVERLPVPAGREPGHWRGARPGGVGRFAGVRHQVWWTDCVEVL